MDKMDEIELGIFYGLRFVFSPLLTKIRDSTLPDMERNIRENFNHEIDFKNPEKGSHVPYQNEFVLNKLGLDSKFETAYRIMQTGDIVSRTFHFIQKDFSTYVIIDYENLKEPVEWRFEGDEGKTDSDNEEHILVLPYVHITAKSQVTTRNNGFVFNLTNGQPQVLLHIETFPLYKEFERTVIIADSTQVDEVAAVLGFFPDHKYVPVIFFENKDNEILRKNNKELKDQIVKIIDQRRQILKHLYELQPRNFIILNSPIEIEYFKQISSMINAKVHQLIDPASGNCLPLEELVAMVSMVFDKNYSFMSVENHSYLAAACVLARIKGTSGKPFIPIVQSRAEHEPRIGSAGYGSGEYCGALTDVTQNIMQMVSYESDEGVIIEYDGTGQSIMRSILASNYAYMNHTVPVLVEKTNVVNEIEDINRDLQYVADYYKFLEYLKFYKTEVLNEDDLKYSNESRDIKTLNYLKSIDANDERSFKEIEKSENLFCWQEIPGNDSERLINFLVEKYFVEWAKTAKIDKINDGKIISLTSGKRLILLTLNNENTAVNLKIDDVGSYEFIMKTTNGKMNIYNYNIEKIIDWIDKHGEFLPDGPIEISKEIKSKLLKVSDKITTSLGSSIQLLHDFKYITAFTDGTPYNLAKCGNEFWATRFALGHFVEDESHKVAAVLLNLLMYSKGREYPIKRILQVAPYASEHSVFKFTRQDDAYATTKLDTGEVTRKWVLVFELINDKSDKDTVIEFGKYISWFNMHFGTHGSGSSIALGKNAELRLNEIMDFNLSHTLIDLNACQTYPFAGKEILSSGAAGGYATLFIVTDKTANDIGKGVFHGTLNHREPSESLRENIEKVVKAGSDGISEFAYVHIGLPKLKPSVIDILDSNDNEIQRMKYDEMLDITRDWIENKRKGQNACFQNYIRQKEEYLKYIKDDHEERFRLFFNEGVLEYRRESFKDSIKMYMSAYGETKYLDDKTEFLQKKSGVLVNLIAALFESDRIDEAEIWLSKLKDMATWYLDSVEINHDYGKGLYNLISAFLKKGKPEEAERHLPSLSKQADRYPDSVEINLIYAKGLRNLIAIFSEKGKPEEAERFLPDLAKHADRYQDLVEINLEYAEGLKELISAFVKKEKTEEIEGLLPDLAKHADRYQDSVEINLAYANGLVGLILAFGQKGKPVEAERHLSELAKQADWYPDSVEIKLQYAAGLLILIIAFCKTGKLEGAERYLPELAKQADRYPDLVGINLAYANGLSSLINTFTQKGKPEEAEIHIPALAKQADSYLDSVDIQLEYAKGLGNLIVAFAQKGKPEEAEIHIPALAKQADSHLDSVDIQLEYAKGLGYLIAAFAQKGITDGAEGHLPELAKQAGRYLDSVEINLEYSKGLVDLIAAFSKKGKSDEAERYLPALAKQADRYPDSVEINFQYAAGFGNLIAIFIKKGNPEEAERYLSVLAKQADVYPNSLEINLAYANRLHNLINSYIEKGKPVDAERHISKLAKQAVRNLDSVDIQLEYAKGLGNLIVAFAQKGKPEEAERYLPALANQADRYPDSVEINLAYAAGLCILIAYVQKGKPDEAERHLLALAKQADQYPKSVEINLIYATGLWILITAFAQKEKPEKAERYLPALANQADQYSKSVEINFRYTEGLNNLIFAFTQKGKTEEAEIYLSALSKQVDRYPDSVEINLAYANRLNNLITAFAEKEKPEEAERHLLALAKQADRYPDSVEINLAYANRLNNLITAFAEKEKPEEAERHLLALAKQADRYPDSVEISLEYANGLASFIIMSYFNRKDYKTIRKFLLLFDKLAEQFADNQQIQELHDKVLGILNK